MNDPARVDVGHLARQQQARQAKEATLKGIAKIIDHSENMTKGQIKRALARVIGAGIDAATDTGAADAVDDLPIQRGVLKIFEVVENLLSRSPEDLEARAQELLELAQEKRQRQAARQAEAGRGNGQ